MYKPRSFYKEINKLHKFIKKQKKINAFLTANEWIDPDLKTLCFICYVHAKNNKLNPIDLFKKMNEAKLIDTYLKCVSNKSFILEIKSNYQDLNFWKKKLYNTIEVYLLDFNNNLNEFFKKNNYIYNDLLNNLTNLALSFFIINNQIEKVDISMQNNIDNFDKYDVQVKQIAYNLEMVNRIQKLLMELNHTSFGDYSVALNILSKRLY